MKLINPSYNIIPQIKGLQGIYEQIEMAGRTCYKSEPIYKCWSEDRTRWVHSNAQEVKEGFISLDDYPIQENISAKEFVDRMIKSGHGAMLEHGTVYLTVPKNNWTDLEIDYYRENPYSKITGDITHLYITTNYRVLVENDWLDDLQYLCEPTEFHEKRITVEFHTDRITGESFLRHRAIDEDHPELHFTVTKEIEKDIDSFARQSTRFCNFDKEKFSSQITYIIPSNIELAVGKHVRYDPKEDANWKTVDGEPIDENNTKWLLNGPGVVVSYGKNETNFLKSLEYSEKKYFELLEGGWQPQFARYVLNFSLYSPLVMTAFTSDWKHFFMLRCDKSAHPDAQALAIPLEKEFKTLKLI